MYLRVILSLIVTAIVVFVLMKTINLREAQELLADFPKDALILLLTISALISSIKAYRFFRLLRDSENDVSFWPVFRSYLAGGLTSSLPGGELFRISLLKKDNSKLHTHQTTAPILTQSYVEMFSAIVIVMIGSFLFEIFLVPAIMAFLLVVGMFFILAHDKPLRIVIKRSVKFERINEFLQKLRKSQNLIRESYFTKKKLIPNKSLMNSLLISLVIHGLGGLLLLLIVYSLDGDINYFESLYIYTLGIVVSSIGSISPGGLGFTDGAMTAALIFFGVMLPAAFIVVVIFRIVTLVFNILLGILFLLMFYRSILIRR